MARKTLGSLLGAVEEAQVAPEHATTHDQADREAAAPSPATPPTALAVAPTERPAAPPARPEPQKKTAKAAPAPATAPADGGPRYLELIRKEARFTDEQLDELAAITRRLNKARHGKGERLTDNTLIRVAVDLLLAKRDRLAGVTEADLRKSVGL